MDGEWVEDMQELATFLFFVVNLDSLHRIMQLHVFRFLYLLSIYKRPRQSPR